MDLSKNKILCIFYFFSYVACFPESIEFNARIRRDVLFRVPTYTGSKTERMCNGYITQACNGILTRRRFKRSEGKSILMRNLTDLEDDDIFHSSVAGGRLSRPKEYPHMALIGYGSYSEVKWLCGGTLISENFVLSAAHCVSSNSGNPTWIRLGELDLASTKDDAKTADFPVTEVIVHPGYNHPVLYHDIALFKFKGLFSFTDYIRPICLNIFLNIADQKVTAAGWGSTGYGETNSPELLSVELDIEDGKLCDRLYTGNRLPNGFNESTMLCVGYAPGGKDTCQGDSGGPLQIPNINVACSNVPIYKQIGIVSFGQSCALPDTPGVYTKVSYYVPWIESIVWS